MSDHYILDGTTPVPCDLLTWAQWFETADRHVAETMIAENVWVSTVFLRLDHQWGVGPPLLFETMCFASQYPRIDNDCERCSTWSEAEAMHAHMCAHVREALDQGRASRPEEMPR